MASGTLHKMHTVLEKPVRYSLTLSDETIDMNTLLGKSITLHFNGNIFCVHCGRKTNKSFQQGYCFPCLRELQSCNLCMIHPERCLIEEGGCDPSHWAHANCDQAHIVYLANSSHVKVGITRASQVPTRWIDQGAHQALPIFSVQNRRQSGVVEVALKAFISDKTNWRAMLKSVSDEVNLYEMRDKLLDQAKPALTPLLEKYKADITELNEKEIIINYPVDHYPEKITSFNFDKNPEVSGILHGIKAQYLILDTGVINIRKFGGYDITLKM